MNEYKYKIKNGSNECNISILVVPIFFAFTKAAQQSIQIWSARFVNFSYKFHWFHIIYFFRFQLNLKHYETTEKWEHRVCVLFEFVYFFRQDIVSNSGFVFLIFRCYKKISKAFQWLKSSFKIYQNSKNKHNNLGLYIHEIVYSWMR